MVKTTEKFRVILQNPWVIAGDVFHRDYITKEILPPGQNPEDYLNIFSRVYRLSDGYECCLGDTIWRSKNYEVKSTIFSKIHIEQETPIFSSREDCEEWLDKNARNIKAELLKQNRDSSFQTLKSWVNKLDKMEELPFKDLMQIRDGIRKCILNIENQS